MILSAVQAIAQQKIYTQEDIYNFDLYNPTPEKLSKFRTMLESNAELVCWMSYYKQKCYYHLVKKEDDSVLFYGKKGLQYLKNKDLTAEKYEVEEQFLKALYLYMAIVLTNSKKQYKASTEYLLKAKELITKYPNFKTTNHPFIYRYLIENFLEMGDENKAIKYCVMVSKDSVYMQLPENAASTYNYLGILYQKLEKKDSAFYWFSKTLIQREKTKDYAGIRALYNNIGDLYRHMEQLDSTLYYYKKSKDLLMRYPNQNYGISKYFTQSNFGYVLIEEGETEKAIKTLKVVLDSVSKIKKVDDNLKNLKTTTFDYLIKAYKKNNQLKKALEVSLQKSEILEKFHQQVLDQKLRELNITYEVKEKDASIFQLETTAEQQSTTIKQRNFLLLALGGLLLSVSGIGFLIFRQRKLKNKYETANLEQRLLRSQLNPHFVFNALNTVSSLASKKSEKTSSYISKLSSLIRLILKNSREEFVTLEDELKFIEDYLELQSNFSQKFKYQIIIEETIVQEETYIPPMFIQPFIENSIEHGLRGSKNGNIRVDIRINEKDKLLECKIMDNGIGVDRASEFKNKNGVEYESFSGKILKERLRIYSRSLNKKAKYTIQPLNKEKGTKVNILLPYVLE